MNRQKIKSILNTTGLNFSRHICDRHKTHYSYFNPHTSELVEFDCYVWQKNSQIDLYVTNVRQLQNSIDMVPHHQNFIRPFRSFILATLVANQKLVLCKSESAARRYKNLGGVVVCIRNFRANKQWGVLK